MKRCSKGEQPSPASYVPKTLEEKEEAFRLAAQHLREARKDLEPKQPGSKRIK